MALGIIVFVLTALYGGLLIAVVLRIPDAVAIDSNTPVQPAVSVIVAARNEEEHLPACLEALAGSDYPGDQVEFIIADDGSTDRTASIVRTYAAQDARFRLLSVDRAQPLAGKARAIHQAIQVARNELIVLTDADCTPPPHWLPATVTQFHAPETGLVAGTTLVRATDLQARVQALDWLYLFTCAAAASAMNHPISAMGNNMAFRREVYEAVGGYPALPASVTEDYELFQAVARSRRWTARLLCDRRTTMITEPVSGFRAAFAQRRRWARGGLRAPAWLKAIYVLGSGTHAAILATLVFAPVTGGLAALTKVALDALVLKRGASQAGTAIRPATFLAFEVWTFFYQIAMPFALAFSPRINWKGRRY